MSSPPEEQDAAGAPQPDAKKPGPTASQSADAIAEAALRAAQEAIASANAGMQPTKQPPQPQQAAATASPTAAAQPAAEAQASSGKSTPGAVQMPDFAPQASASTTADLPTERVPDGIALLDEVNLNVKIELGRTRMLIEDVLRLGEGSVVELDKLAGDPVDVYVNDRHVARGEVLVLSDNFCVRISEIISPSGEDNKARRTG